MIRRKKEKVFPPENPEDNPNLRLLYTPEEAAQARKEAREDFIMRLKKYPGGEDLVSARTLNKWWPK